MTDSKREVFVLERRGVPTRVEREKWYLLQQLEAGVRLGIPVGEEEIVRYVPEAKSSRTWIPCSDRMPAHLAPVFFVIDGIVCTGDFDASSGGSWSDAAGYWPAARASHWMPRFVEEAPEPPT